MLPSPGPYRYFFFFSTNCGLILESGTTIESGTTLLLWLSYHMNLNKQLRTWSAIYHNHIGLYLNNPITTLELSSLGCLLDFEVNDFSKKSAVEPVDPPVRPGNHWPEGFPGRCPVRFWYHCFSVFTRGLIQTKCQNL